MHFDKYRFGVGLLIAACATFLAGSRGVAGTYPDITQSKANMGYQVPVDHALGQSFTAVETGRVTHLGISTNGGYFDLTVYAGAGDGGTVLYSEKYVLFGNTAAGVSHIYALKTPIAVTKGQIYTFKILNRSPAEYGTRMVHSSNDGTDAYPGGRRYTFGGPDDFATADLAFVVKGAQ